MKNAKTRKRSYSHKDCVRRTNYGGIQAAKLPRGFRNSLSPLRSWPTQSARLQTSHRRGLLSYDLVVSDGGGHQSLKTTLPKFSSHHLEQSKTPSPLASRAKRRTWLYDKRELNIQVKRENKVNVLLTSHFTCYTDLPHIILSPSLHFVLLW